jgi:chemotaxis protein MotB
MKRRHPAPPSGPHALRASGDRWLFGYADMVTLLFACFASLYAARTSPAAAALPDSNVPPSLPGASAGQEPRATSMPPRIEERAAPAGDDLARELATVLRPEGTVPRLEIGASPRGIVISLPEAGSFAPGRTELSPAARSALLELALLLRERPLHLRVEGHTDDVPIRTERYSSNWELSTARATTVVQLLIDEGHLAPGRLAAAGYANHRPRVANTTPEQRASNRRVEIVVLDNDAAALEGPRPLAP